MTGATRSAQERGLWGAWPARPIGRTSPAWIVVSGLLLIFAGWLRTRLQTDPDVSWLLYVAQRILDGATLYRDVLEVNPPASFLIYVPAILLSRVTGLSPEAMADVLVFAGVGSCLAICSTILVRADVLRRYRADCLLSGTIVLLLVLPFQSFAQREHVALIAMLPILACLLARAHAEPVGRTNLVAAGIAAGVAIAIKPFFGLALLGPALYVLARPTRVPPWRIPELWVAGAIATTYAIYVVVFVPEFVSRVLPLVSQIYVPARMPLIVLLTSVTSLIWLALVCTFRQIAAPDESAGMVLLLASAGFEACVFVQGKGFFYHAYPAIALAALGCAFALCRRARDGRPPRWLFFASLVPAAAALVAAFITYRGAGDPAQKVPGLEQAVAAIAPHPTILTIGGQMVMGRALAREMGAEWVGSSPIAWITFYAGLLVPDPEADPRFAGPIRMEREFYARDIDESRPEIVLIDGAEWTEWARKSVALVRALSAYREVGRFGAVTLLRRAGAPHGQEPAVPPQLDRTNGEDR